MGIFSNLFKDENKEFIDSAFNDLTCIRVFQSISEITLNGRPNCRCMTDVVLKDYEQIQSYSPLTGPSNWIGGNDSEIKWFKGKEKFIFHYLTFSYGPQSLQSCFAAEIGPSDDAKRTIIVLCNNDHLDWMLSSSELMMVLGESSINDSKRYEKILNRCYDNLLNIYKNDYSGYTITFEVKNNQTDHIMPII